MSKLSMGRIIKTIEIEGRRVTALFDSGAVYTYVVSSFLTGVPGRTVSHPVRVVLRGQSIDIREIRLVEGKIEGLDFFTEAVPVNDLGVAEGGPLDAIIGARTLEQWEIRLDPKTGTLNLDFLQRRELTEFAAS